MSSISESYIAELIHCFADRQRITDITIKVQKFERLAQNYFGDLIAVILDGKTSDGDVSLHLAVKLAPTNERFRVSGALAQMFAREIFIYSRVLSAYERLQAPFASEYVMPRCHFVRSDHLREGIVMENMCARGYSPYADERFLDIDHVTLALKALAKFHALSFILRVKDNVLYEDVSNTCVPLNETTNRRFMEVLRDRLDKATDKFQGSKYDDVLKNLKENCVNLLQDVATNVKDTVLCHGDIWKENILFKYKEGGPTSACIIDYQTCRMASPAYDVLFLITTSTDFALRAQYFRGMIDIYYQEFKDCLESAQYEASSVYSKDDFHHDLAAVSPACLIVANTALWLASGLQEEGHVRSKLVHKTREEKEVAVESYKCIIKNIIDNYISYGYLKNVLKNHKNKDAEVI